MGSSVSTYFRTICHLKPRQLAALVMHRMRGKWDRPKQGVRGGCPSLPGWNGVVPPLIPAPTPGLERASILRGELEFIGEKKTVGWPPRWEVEEAGKLWRYNLHYHQWLWPLVEHGDWQAVFEVVTNWIRENPPARGGVGWDPYPTSLRLQSWVLLLFLEGKGRMREAGVADLVWESVWTQACWLENRLECHLMGNHLLENLATLTLLGQVFEGQDGVRWRAKAQSLLETELGEQVLPDGMHFELSPMYHERVAWLLEMLVGIRGAEGGGDLEEMLVRMKRASACLRHPDGDIALLNDAGSGVYATCNAEPAGSGAWALPDAGYYGYRTKDGDYLVCDAGNLGPDHIPGHAHADCLSFELSVGGRRMIVDAGVSDYEISDTRRYVRSTSAHNTVEIDGEDQAEMWGAFRVGARGRTRVLAWRPSDIGFHLEAEHNGYARLPARAHHRRMFRLEGRELELRDMVHGRRQFRAVGRLHFAPGCQLVVRGNQVSVRAGKGAMEIEFEGGGALDVGESPYYARFGQKVMRPVLEYRVGVVESASWRTIMRW